MHNLHHHTGPRTHIFSFLSDITSFSCKMGYPAGEPLFINGDSEILRKNMRRSLLVLHLKQ